MFNQIVLYGRLTADPEIRQTQTGNTVCSFTIAVDRPKTKDGNQTADFIKCNCWNKTADMVSKYFNKGKPIMVTGRLQNNDYTDQNGVKHYSYVVLVSSVSFSINDSSQNQAVDGGQQAYQRNHTPNYQNAVQNGYSSPVAYQQKTPPPVYPPLPREQVESLDDFEEILNEGQLPF